MDVQARLISRDAFNQLAAIDDLELTEASGVATEMASRELRLALALQHFVNRLAPMERDPLKVFYSRVYWFNRFVHMSERGGHKDVGLDQQAFAILEEAPANVDWNVVEQVVGAARGPGPT